MLKKKPEGSEWELFVKEWYESDHVGKEALSAIYGTTYGTAKHWISDSGATQKKVIEAPQDWGNNKPLTLNVSKEQQTIAIIGDTHNPYQDKKAVELCQRFLREIQPDYLIFNGDINDFYQVSEFAKDPKRVGNIQEDLDDTKEMLNQFNLVLPQTKKILIEGTHEYRWKKYLQKNSPAVSNLNCLTISDLYDLKNLGIELVEYEKGLLINNTFLVLHGTIASKYSSETAKNQFIKNGGSGICNHTHRGGSFFKRDRFGVWGWWENFCLCQLNPDWIQNPDWVQGFSLIHFTSEERYFVEQIPIIEGKMMYGGKLYS